MLTDARNGTCATRPVVPEVGIVIPACNEQDRIGAALDAVIDSCRRVAVPCRIVVVDDGSTDATARIARQVLAGHCGAWEVTYQPVRCVGTARRLGVEIVERSAIDASSTWLLSTDADSEVAEDWVERYLRHHERGAVAVAGVVCLTDDHDSDRIRDRWSADYRPTIAPDGSHPYVHAANLGIRLDVYRQIGGFRDIDRIEDADLWERLRAAGFRPVADADISVATSARQAGRVERGFAHALNCLYG